MKFTRIALPQEHGSWGFFLEPIILAVLIAYSPPGVFLAISSFFIFLAHQPIRVLFDKKISRENKSFAFAIFLAYAGISLLFLWKVFSLVNFYSLFPYFFSLLLMIGFLFIEINTRKENFIARLVPPLAVCLTAVSIVLFSRTDIEFATAFYWVLLGRSATTSIYIHEKLKKLKREKFYFSRVMIIHLLFLFVLLFLVILGNVPILSIVALLILFVRSIIGLKSQKKTNVRKIGLWEFAHGVIYLVIVSIGYLLNI